MTAIDSPAVPGVQASRAHAAEQRSAAAAVNTAVAAARVERTRARHIGADRRRLAEAFEVLSEQIAGHDPMAVLEPGNVLRHGPGVSEAGTGSMAAVCEYVARIMRGEWPHDAIEEMHEARLERCLAPAVGHADAAYQHAHRLENAAAVHPAIPAAQAGVAGAALPHRDPGMSVRPPVPPESAVQSTGRIALRTVREVLADGGEAPRSRAALAGLGPAVPVFEVDEAFNPVSIPAQRDVRDTQPLRLDEVLGHFGQADAGVGDEEPEPVVRPFAGAGPDGGASPDGTGSGDGDD